MNDLVNRQTGEIINYIKPEAQEAAAALVSAKALAALAKKQGAFESLEIAELIILEQQRTIAQEYKATFEPGRPEKNSPTSGRISADEWCRALGTSQSSVNRWADELIDEQKYAQKVDAIQKKVRQMIELFLSANTSSNSEEWYTPMKYLEAIHKLYIPDLDPASNKFANKTVKAKTFWTRKDSDKEHTLERDWFGKVFCNPPYGKDPEFGSLAGAFCNKAMAEYEMGNIDECILLVNSLHSQNWQAPLFDYVICFVDHRIQFVSGDGTENKNPTMQNMFIYMGDRKELFSEAFTPFGYVMEKVSA